MRKRLIVSVVVLVILLGALVASRYQVPMLGWLHGEAFYAGQPTSYWMAAIKESPRSMNQNGMMEKDLSARLALANGGPAAAGVLKEMLRADDVIVVQQTLQILGGQNIETNLYVESLVEYLKTAKEPEHFRMARDIVQRVNPQLATKTTLECLRSAADLRTRVAAIYATRDYQRGRVEPEMLTAVESVLEDPALPVQVASANVILQMQPPHPRHDEILLRSIRIRGQAQKEYPWLSTSVNESFPVMFGGGMMMGGPFGRKEKLTPQLIELLHDADPNVREHAMKLLRPMTQPMMGPMHKPDPSLVPGLLEALKIDDSSVQIMALHLLGQVGTGAVASVAVGGMVTNPDPNVQNAARATLALLAPDDVKTFEILSKAFHDQPGFRYSVVQALASSPQLSIKAIPLYIEALRPARQALPESGQALPASGQGEDFQLAALRALQALGPKSKPGLPALLTVLDNPTDEFTRAQILQAIEAIGPEARTAVPKLVREMKNQDTQVSVRAIVALVAIEPTNAALPAAVNKVLHSPAPSPQQVAGPNGRMINLGLRGSPDWRHQLVQILARAGKTARPLVPTLLAGLGIKDENLRLQIAIALWSIEQRTDKNVDALVELLNSDDESVVRQSLQTLEKIGPPAKTAIPALTRLITEGHRVTQLWSATTLLSIDPKNPLPLQTLIAGLKSDDMEIQRLAIERIGYLGPKAVAAERDLKDLRAKLATTKPTETVEVATGIVNVRRQVVNTGLVDYALQRIRNKAMPRINPAPDLVEVDDDPVNP
jgi:HEAT repeat protein